MPEVWVRRSGWLASVAIVFLSAAALRANAQSAPLNGETAAPAPSQYWLGVFSTPVDDTLRSHLQLPAGQGLVVKDVFAESPALAAGLEVHDILLSLGGTDLSAPDQLSQVVDAVGMKEVEATLIRGGKRLTLSIQPALRPMDDETDEDAPADDDVSREFSAAIAGWVDKFGAAGAQKRIGFHIIRPGVIEAGHLDVSCCTKILPDGLMVRVQYEGAKSPTIEVCRGDERWQATADNLDSLPPDVRMYAWQVTQPSVMYIPREKFPGTVEIKLPGDSTMQTAGPAPEVSIAPEPSIEQLLHQRLEELARELVNLRKSVDKLAATDKKSGE